MADISIQWKKYPEDFLEVENMTTEVSSSNENKLPRLPTLFSYFLK